MNFSFSFNGFFGLSFELFLFSVSDFLSFSFIFWGNDDIFRDFFFFFVVF